MAKRNSIVIEQPDGLTDEERADLLASLDLSRSCYDVLIRLVAGKQHKCIAYELGLSVAWVKVCLSRLRKKKCAENNVQLVTWFLRQTYPRELTYQRLASEPPAISRVQTA